MDVGEKQGVSKSMEHGKIGDICPITGRKHAHVVFQNERGEECVAVVARERSVDVEEEAPKEHRDDHDAQGDTSPCAVATKRVDDE